MLKESNSNTSEYFPRQFDRELEDFLEQQSEDSRDFMKDKNYEVISFLNNLIAYLPLPRAAYRTEDNVTGIASSEAAQRVVRAVDDIIAENRQTNPHYLMPDPDYDPYSTTAYWRQHMKEIISLYIALRNRGFSHEELTV